MTHRGANSGELLSQLASLFARAYLRLPSETASKELAVSPPAEASCDPVDAREESAA